MIQPVSSCVVVGTGLSGPEEGLGAGLDSCVLPTRHEGISIVQTTDLYPLTLSSFSHIPMFYLVCRVHIRTV